MVIELFKCLRQVICKWHKLSLFEWAFVTSTQYYVEHQFLHINFSKTCTLISVISVRQSNLITPIRPRLRSKVLEAYQNSYTDNKKR